jgi:hypothetical protein
MTQDFIPTRSHFHIHNPSDNRTILVSQDELKALFFVRNLNGDPHRVDIPAFTRGPAENAYGRKIAVRFPDGELICGYSVAYSTAREGFFMSTMDARGNNERIYVVLSPGVKVLEGAAAEDMLRHWSNPEAA